MKLRTFVFASFVFLASCNKNNIIDQITGPEALHNRAVGASANELLSADKYTSLKVEVQYMTGFVPDDAALNHLHNFLSTYVNKPGGITITTKEIAAAANTTFNTSDVVALEKSNRTVYSNGTQLALYIVYTNGQFSDNNVLGAAYRNTSAVIFGKKIRDNSGGLGQPSRTKLEATVLAHEAGHLLGLVDNGTAMQSAHKDAAHDSHCSNKNCLMYYAAETTDALGFLVTGNIPALDAACAADLQGNGGK